MFGWLRRDRRLDDMAAELEEAYDLIERLCSSTEKSEARKNLPYGTREVYEPCTSFFPI